MKGTTAMRFPYANAARNFLSDTDRDDFAGLTLSYRMLPASRAFLTVAGRARGEVRIP